MSHYPQVSDTELTWKLVSFLPQTVTTTHLIHLQQSVTDAAANPTLLSDIAEKISPIGIDVTVLWSVCLSCSCIVFKRQKISTGFLLHTTAQCFPDHVKFGLHRSGQPILSKFCFKVTHLLLISASETLNGNYCGRVVRDSALVTIESL